MIYHCYTSWCLVRPRRDVLADVLRGLRRDVCGDVLGRLLRDVRGDVLGKLRRDVCGDISLGLPAYLCSDVALRLPGSVCWDTAPGLRRSVLGDGVLGLHGDDGMHVPPVPRRDVSMVVVLRLRRDGGGNVLQRLLCIVGTVTNVPLELRSRV